MTRLTLTGFRCYEQSRVETDAQLVVLTGPNGAGKTNVLEALSYLTPGRGLRSARLTDVVRKRAGSAGYNAPIQAPWGVAATVARLDGPVDIGTGFAGGDATRRSVRIDGEDTGTQSALADLLGIQWLTPQMDRLFLEGASGRRRFLDRMVFGTDPAHAGRVTAYEHAMRERARLLKNRQTDDAWLSGLEATMAEKGIACACARLDMAGQLAEMLENRVGNSLDAAFPAADIAVEGDVEAWVQQGSALQAEDQLRTALRRNRAVDADTGRTQAGPHRSDLKVFHRSKKMPAELCSTGEQKALLISLVLAHARLHSQRRGAPPILLLDEIAAHLDDMRRKALFDEIRDIGAQAWTTGTDRALFEPLQGEAAFFNVIDAQITADDDV